MTNPPVPAWTFPLRDLSDVGEVRRASMAAAEAAGFDETGRGKVAVVANELSRNVVLHGHGGELFLRRLGPSGSGGVEIVALDKGPGMDVGRSLRDGYSTAGTAGIGLGAVSRLSSEFEAFSAPGAGAIVRSRLWAKPADAGSEDDAPLDLGVAWAPAPGETVCGDAWAVEHAGPQRELMMIADGLGHGPLAGEASDAARRILLEHLDAPPQDLIERMHAALRATRGAAIAVAEIDRRTRQVRFAGVGNISAALIPKGGRTQNMVSSNGTVGHEMRRVQTFTYPWDAGTLVVMHSDGVGTSWRLDPYPGLAARHPAVIAAVLYRDFKRGRDDATVLVAREPVSPSTRTSEAAAPAPGGPA